MSAGLDLGRVRPLLERYLASPLTRFVPWVLAEASPQRDYVLAAATHPVRVLRSGNQCGKTTVMLVDALLQLLGEHPAAPFRPPLRVVVSVLNRVDGIGRVAWPELERWLPRDRVRTIRWWRRSSPAIPETVVFVNGGELHLKTAEQGRRMFQGMSNVHLACVDEEHPADVVEELRMRLARKGGHLAVAATPVDGVQWLEQIEAEPTTRVITASTVDAARAGLLDLPYVERLERDLPPDQRDVRLYGLRRAREGRVYKGVAAETHLLRPAPAGRARTADGRIDVPYPLPPEWERYAAHDFGYGVPAATVLTALTPARDLLVVERIYYAAGVRVTTWIEAVLAGLPALAAPLVADHDADGRAELDARGHPTLPAPKGEGSVLRGLEAVARWLRGAEGGVPRLVFLDDLELPSHPLTGRCDGHWAWWELQRYEYARRDRLRDGARDPRDEPIKRDDHALDALRYLVAYLDARLGGGLDLPRARVPAGADRGYHRGLPTPLAAPWGAR